MATKIVKYTGRGRKARGPKEIKHVRRMVQVADEHIEAADNEIYDLEVGGFKWETRYLRTIILTVKAMLPGAVKELENPRQSDAHENVIKDQQRDIERYRCILAKMCHLPNKLITTKNQISRYKHMLEDSEERLLSEKHRLTILKEDYEILYQEHDTLQEKYEKLEQENETLKHENKKRLDHIKHEILLEKKKGHEHLIQGQDRYQNLRNKYDQVLRQKKELHEETAKLKKEYNSKFLTMQKQIETLKQELANLKRSHKSQLHDQKLHLLNTSFQESTEKKMKLYCDHKTTSHNQQQLEENTDHKQMKVDQLPRETIQYRRICEQCHAREQDENKEAFLTTKYVALQKELDKMIDENRNIRGELVRCNENAQKQEQEYAKISSDMKQIIEVKRNELTELIKAKEIQQQQLHEIALGFEKKICEINQKNSLSLQNIKKEKIQEIHSLDITNKELGEKNQQLQVEISQLLQDRKKLEEDLMHERTTVRKSEQTTQSSLQEHIEKLRQEVYELKNEKEKVYKELVLATENVRKNEEEYSQRNNYLQQKTEMLEKEMDSLKADFERKHNKKQNELLQLKEEKLKLNEVIKQEMEVAKTKEKEILQNVSKMEKIIEVKRNKITNLKMANEEQQKQINDYLTELDKQRKENSALKTDLIIKTKNARNQEELMSSVTEENYRLQKELDKLQNEQQKWLKELTIEKENVKTKEEENNKNMIKFNEINCKKQEEIGSLIEALETHIKENETQQNELRKRLQEKNERNKLLIQENKNNKLTIEGNKQKSITMQQTIETQKLEIDQLQTVNKKLKEAVEKRNRQSQFEDKSYHEKGLQEQLSQVNKQLANTQQELEETKSRLSRAMGDKLTDNNPNIADLSDRNRPTKISERYQELYDNQWTDAFETVDKTIQNEEKSIEMLMDIIVAVMAYCKSESTKQMKQIMETLSKGNELSAYTIKQLKDCRKSTAEIYGMKLYTEYWNTLKQQHSETAKFATEVPKYVKECFEICWLMAVQDPPVVLGPDSGRNAPFNKDHYKAYTKGGDRLDYIVWPVLLLHQDGPVLCKGVAQGH